MALLTRSKCSEKTTKLVVSIDVGTTYTAASYCIFYNNTQPYFQEINRWPKQVFPDAKIPSVLYYDSFGVAQLYGAETEDETLLLDAEVGDWKKADWWKLLLRPEYLPAPVGFLPCVLPPRVTVDDVFRDQFVYVMKNVRAFFVKAHGNGEKLWEDLSASMFVILTTPNGWEGRHQNRMRLAAIEAGIISLGERNRVRFVSEGEAAIHYCLDSVRSHSVKIGSNVVVCDAGGGTTDIGVYKIRSVSPINLEEISSPRCFLAGGVFVNALAKTFITGRLRGSQWDTDEYIANAMRTFERQVKRSFRGSEGNIFVTLDGSSVTDEGHSIIRGRLKITRAEMIKFFDPSIKLVKDGLQEILAACEWDIDQIFIVGGFAESEYVYSEIEKMTSNHNIPIGKPDGALSKAIAHGALSWHINSGVQIRIAKLHYGAETDVEYSSSDSEMIGRNKFQNILGQWKVRHAWKTIVKKNSTLKVGKEHCTRFHREFGEKDKLRAEMELYAYRWQEPPKFFEDKDGNLTEGFIHLGTVKANLKRCFDAMPFSNSPSGKRYKTLEYDVCLLFDEIEIQARLRWRENGVSVHGDATIVYDL